MEKHLEQAQLPYSLILLGGFSESNASLVLPVRRSLERETALRLRTQPFVYDLSLQQQRSRGLIAASKSELHVDAPRLHVLSCETGCVNRACQSTAESG
jgi:hypothetical protein